VGSESISRVSKYSIGFIGLSPYNGKNRCTQSEYAVHEGNGAEARRVMGIVFVQLIYELGGAGSPFWGGVTVVSRYCEEGEDNIVSFFGEELEDFAG
jgi:hypothetical protein